MLSLEITSLRDFTRHLFTRESFDAWHVLDVSISSFIDFHMDGHINPAFFEETEESIPRFCDWGKLRPVCFSFIRGKLMPLSFKITLVLSAQDAAGLMNADGLSALGDSTVFTLLLHYREHQLVVTTGTLDQASVSFDRTALNSRKENQQLFDRAFLSWLDMLGIPSQVR